MPIVKIIELYPHDWPPTFAKWTKHRECDTLLIINSTGYLVEVLDVTTMNSIPADSISGDWERLYYYNLTGIESIIVAHQFVEVFYTISISACETNDCDDNNSLINAGQTEIPYNELNDDCNSATADDDIDMDGFGIESDCNDENPFVNPDETEIVYNGLDDDCDIYTLDDDLDQDGFGIADDCNDDDPNISPNAIEIPNNGIDENCDGNDFLTTIHLIGNTSISIYPNPVSDVLYVVSSNPTKSFKILLYDGKGKIVLPHNHSRTLYLGDLLPGLYVLQIIDPEDQSQIFEKIIIQ